MASDEPIHLAIRYADCLLSLESTIAEHEAVIKKRGAVWFGKLGRPVGRQHVARVNRQCRAGAPTYVFLVQKVGSDYVAHRGTVVQVSRDLPEGEQRLVPGYYSEEGLMRKIKFWVKLSDISALRRGSLSQLKVASSGMNLYESLKLSMAPVFIVKEGRGRSF